MVDHISARGAHEGRLARNADSPPQGRDDVPASATVVALRNSDNRVTHFVGVERDITEELKLRDQLVHSERLSAVGGARRGRRARINNPLQTIIGSVELMLEERDADHTRDLEVVRLKPRAPGRSSATCSPSSARARPTGRAWIQPDRRRDARLDRTRSCTRTSRSTWGAPGVLAVLVNREEIQQVVLNLVLNADTIGDRQGRIVIRTDAGEHAHTLQVMDDGPGISLELRGRVFEPFFTTKEVGQGTGLGLSLGLGIATAHGGSLELCPPSGRGACFKLTLPAQRAAENGTGDGQAPATRRRGERRQALVIEDEPPIRELLVRLLTRRDYAVTEAASYREAKTVTEGKTFDLVLCDVRLEDGSGAECLRHLMGAQPAIGRRFIFVTGDAGGIGDEQREFAGIPVLTKPFTASDFERVLGDVEVGV